MMPVRHVASSANPKPPVLPVTRPPHPRGLVEAADLQLLDALDALMSASEQATSPRWRQALTAAIAQIRLARGHLTRCARRDGCDGSGQPLRRSCATPETPGIHRTLKSVSVPAAGLRIASSVASTEQTLEKSTERRP